MTSLKNHNTFGFDVKCRSFVEFHSEEELRLKIEGLDVNGEPSFFVIGGGSNLLFRGDYEGIILHSAITGVSADSLSPDEILLRCGSGEVMDDVAAYAVEHGFYGMENLSAIPGEVGASAVQNIGAYGVEAKDVIYNVRAYDLQTRTFIDIPAADCCFRYRGSRFKDDWAGRYIITYVTYRLSRTFTPRLDYGNIRAVLAERNIAESRLTAMQLRDAIIDIRRRKLPDPKELGNAGSFFMNPVVSEGKYQELKARHADIPSFVVEGGVKIPAAWLIDKAGWKGRSLGRAAVHRNQPLVLVNTGGATPDEVMNLCGAIQDDVHRLFGIHLKPEVVQV